MIPNIENKSQTELSQAVRNWLRHEGKRLGLLTSIDGNQLVTLLLDTSSSSAHCWLTHLHSNTYHSLTPTIPQAHWFERAIFDLFALVPQGHPRLKPVHLNEAYTADFAPLQVNRSEAASRSVFRDFNYMDVSGEGIFELPVGPVHAGIIEPGHFLLSCMGESVLNLEIRLGYLHRGIEKRLTEVPWMETRFVAEAAASDTACANALACVTALESIIGLEVPEKALYLRALAGEIERLAMHICDIGGMAVDLGYGVVSGAMSRLRGNALRLADLLSGNRFLRGYVCPGGVSRDPDKYLSDMKTSLKPLQASLKQITESFLGNTTVYERLHGVGTVSGSLAKEFGMVGVAARASSLAYDVRSVFPYAVFPELAPRSCVETEGDALARTKVRISEIDSTFELIHKLLDTMPSGKVYTNVPAKLPANSIGLGIVEAFRGELIHLAFTDDQGKIMRYAIKDPSFNNWTGLAIAMRNNVIADFPICNKSFSLSYGGHDL